MQLKIFKFRGKILNMWKTKSPVVIESLTGCTSVGRQDLEERSSLTRSVPTAVKCDAT